MEVRVGLQQPNLDNEDVETPEIIFDSFMSTVECTVLSVKNAVNDNVNDREEDMDALISELTNSINVMEIVDLEASEFASKNHTSSIEDENLID